MLYRTADDAKVLDLPSVIRLPKQEVIGFIPDQSTLSTLINGETIEIDGFDTVVCKNLSWDVIRGLYPAQYGQTFKPAGWRIGILRPVGSTDQPVQDSSSILDFFEVNGNRFTPGTFKIRIDNVAIRDAEIDAFINKLQSGKFVFDLLANGEFEKEIPPYISGKLKEIIEANRTIWHDYKDLDLEAREKKRAETREFLKKGFRLLCKKGSSPKSLMKLAQDVCDPTIVPESKRLAIGTTPDLLALITAAKLFWSPSYIHHDNPKTHPTREEVMAFLRGLGLTEQNNASSGVTVIRPEAASDEKVGERPAIFRPVLRRQIKIATDT